MEGPSAAWLVQVFLSESWKAKSLSVGKEKFILAEVDVVCECVRTRFSAHELLKLSAECATSEVRLKLLSRILERIFQFKEPLGEKVVILSFTFAFCHWRNIHFFPFYESSFICRADSLSPICDVSKNKVLRGPICVRLTSSMVSPGSL